MNLPEHSEDCRRAERVLEASLCHIRDHGPFNGNAGICDNVVAFAQLGSEPLVVQLGMRTLLLDILQTWPGKSGRMRGTPIASYSYFLLRGLLWQGEQLRVRREAMEYAIDWIREKWEAEEA